MGLTGEQLGRYTLARKISFCPEGEDWKARDGSGNRVFVRLYYEQRWMEVFRRTTHAARVPEHPNLNRLLDTFDGNRPWAVWSYASGLTLREILERDSYLRFPTAVPVMIQVLRGLAALHSHNLAHCDLRPENVVIDEDGATTLIGMQTPQYREAVLAARRQLPRKLARAIRAYMPPEQARGTVEGTHGDVYGFGVLFFEALCGQLPNPFELRNPSQFDPRIPKIADVLAFECLERTVRGRPATANGLEERLVEGLHRCGYWVEANGPPTGWVKKLPTSGTGPRKNGAGER